VRFQIASIFASVFHDGLFYLLLHIIRISGNYSGFKGKCFSSRAKDAVKTYDIAVSHARNINVGLLEKTTVRMMAV